MLVLVSPSLFLINSRCGSNPCKDRIQCTGRLRRCVPPTLCCRPIPDLSCDRWHIAECCNSDEFSFDPLQPTPFPADLSNPRLDGGLLDPNFGFRSAIFVVSGCTLAFISLILVATLIFAKFMIRRLRSRHETRRHEIMSLHQRFCALASVLDAQPEETVPMGDGNNVGINRHNLTVAYHVYNQLNSSPPPYYDVVTSESEVTSHLPPAYSQLSLNIAKDNSND